MYKLTAASLLSLLAFIAPLSASLPLATRETDVDPQALITISAASASCDGALYPAECRTAEQAAGPISDSFARYGITNPYEKAALISLMIYETSGFKYAQNYWPGIPGQGTRNMQSPAYNLLYAESVIPADQLAPVENDPVAVLALVNTDELGFASAAWYVTTQRNCPAYRPGLQSGSLEGWHAYLTECVQTTATGDRDAVWNSAIALVGKGIN
jgi:hypothetical protein